MSGCGQSQRPADQREARGILQVLGREYGRYLVDHNDAPPKDEAAFRAYLESQMTRLKSYGVKQVDDLLKSPRDGQPLTIVCGQRIAAPDQPDLVWAAFEQTGVDGKRLACNVRGGVEELDATAFQQRIPMK
jgi:hypothetical protein